MEEETTNPRASSVIKKITENTLVKLIPTVASLIGALITISNFVSKDFIELNFWVVIALLGICWLYCIVILAYKYKRHSKLWRVILFSFIIVLPILTTLFAFNRTGQTACEPQTALMTIGVADFEEAENVQSFSTELIVTLRDKITAGKYNFNVKSVSGFFDVKQELVAVGKRLDLAAQSNCIDRGVIVYGYWNEKKNYPLYRCYLFVHETPEDKKRINHPQRVLDSLNYHIKIPNQFNFEIPRYVNELSEATLGILKFYNGSFAEAKKIFEKNNKTLSNRDGAFRFQFTGFQTNETNNDEYVSMHLFYLATIEVFLGDIKTAARTFDMSFAYDSSNRSALHNYRYLTSLSDSIAGKAYDTIAASSQIQTDPVVRKTQVVPSKKVTPKTVVVVTDTIQQSIVTPVNELASDDTSSKESAPTLNVVRRLSPELVVFMKDGKYGLADDNGNALTEPLYNQFYVVEENFIMVRIAHKVGFLRSNGKPLTEIKYDGAHNFQEGMAAVRLDKKWGFINTKGKEAVPLEYEDVINDFFRETAVVLVKKGKAIRVDKQGRKVRNEKLFFENDY
jgi:hypothetical protein